MKNKNLLSKLFTLVMAIGLIGSLTAQDCPSGLVSLWKFEEAGSPFTDSESGHNAMGDDVPSSTTGKIVNAVEFNGSSNALLVSRHSDFNFNSSSNFSVEAWVKFPEQATNNIIFGSGFSAGAFYFQLGAYGGTGELFFEIGDGGSYVEALSPASQDNDQWHHVVGVRNGSTGTNYIYVDGVEYSDAGSVSGTASAVDLCIGHLNNDGAASNFFDGVIDELAVYNVALSAAQVAENFADGNSGLGICDGDEPKIVSVPNTTAIVGQNYTTTVKATGKPSIIYELVEKPSGMTIDAITGEINWTPATINDEAYVVVRANNNLYPPADTQSFRVYVAEAPICPGGLIGLWKLDETSGSTYVDSYSELDATAVVAPSPTPGIVGGAQNFGASSEITIEDKEILGSRQFDFGIGDDFSFEVWVQTSHTLTDAMVAVGRKRDNYEAQYAPSTFWWLGLNSSGFASFELGDSWGATLGTIAEVTADVPLNDGQWHHLVAVRDGTADMNKLYVDGVMVASTSVHYSHSFGTDNPDDVKIGMLDQTISGFHWVGKIDEVAIFNRALTDANVVSYYNGRNPSGHCSPGNYAPVITSTPVTTVDEDATYSYTFVTEDPDVADNLVLSAPILPSWLNFSWTAGQRQATITGTPGDAHIGDTTIRVRVTDGSLSKTQTFTLSVNNINDVPVITSTAVTTAEEEQEYTYTLIVNDDDINDVITMTEVTTPSWLTFTWTAGDTATLTGTPGNGDEGGPVQINISDGTVTIQESYTITVTPFNDPPVIDSLKAPLSVNEDNNITLTLDNYYITDIDNTPAQLTLAVQAGSNYTVNGTTVTPALNFNGDITVPVTVSDLTKTSEIFNTTITVIPVNDKPVITSVAIESVDEGQLYAYPLVGTDADGDNLTWSINSKPDWLTLTVSNVLTGIAPVDPDPNQFLIIIELSDGTESDDQTFTLTVNDGTSVMNHQSDAFKVYPIPASDFINIEFESLDSDLKVDVYSISGGLVNSFTVEAGNTEYRYDLTGLENGAYYMHLSNDHISQVTQFVITK